MHLLYTALHNAFVPYQKHTCQILSLRSFHEVAFEVLLNFNSDEWPAEGHDNHHAEPHRTSSAGNPEEEVVGDPKPPSGRPRLVDPPNRPSCSACPREFTGIFESKETMPCYSNEIQKGTSYQGSTCKAPLHTLGDCFCIYHT